MTGVNFRRRLWITAGVFGVWLPAALAVHFYLAGTGREAHLQTGRKTALLSREYHAPRARILDRDGTPLAWSERYFDLHWAANVPPPESLLAELDFLAPVRLDALPDGHLLLKRNLRPNQLLQLEKILSDHSDLAVRVRIERIVVSDPAIRREIGEVELDGGRVRGISGAELTFDRQLGGTPGRFEVMLDRYRNWIESSWKLTVPAAPGADVKLDFSIAERRRP